MTTRFAIVTLVLYFLSTILIIQSLSFHVRVPLIGKRRVTIGPMTAPILAIAILWASQCLGATQIRNGIVGTDNIKPYNILVLFMSLAYMTITLDVSGILQAAAFWISNRGGSSGRKLYFYFYVLFTLISIIVGNDPVILSGTVFLVYYTAAVGLDPNAWLISEFAAANIASMVLFVGNPTNVVICEGFQINIAIFTGYTILPFIACSIACYLVLILQYRDEKHVPRKLNILGNLNPRDVLRDPVGAIFGTIWLATCLIVLIVLSFFHVDVWKIVLPFAGGKFIFDICWDHYRYSRGKITKFDEKNPDNVESAGASDLMATAMRRAFDDYIKAVPCDIASQNFGSDLHRHTTDGTNETSTTRSLGNDFERIAIHDSPSSSDDSSNLQKPPQDFRQRLQLARMRLRLTYHELAAHFPTFFTTLPRLPFALVPFIFSQFILIEALEHHGWIDIFARWLVIASNKQIMPVVWLVGVLGVVLGNISGTNIGATILLTRIIRASDFSDSTARAAAVSLAVASNIGAVGFTFSASLGGLLWVAILKDKGIMIKQRTFAIWNALPLFAMTGMGLGVVSAMMAILY